MTESSHPFKGLVTVESEYNPESGLPPFAFYNPSSNGNVTWLCYVLENDDIIGTFQSTLPGDSGRVEEKYETLEKAIQIRDMLVENGWQKMKPPKIELTYPEGEKAGQPLSRKDKRLYQKKIAQMARKNPFIQK